MNRPTYYEGKFMSDQSVTGLSYRETRPATFGTLTAADVGALGANYQLPGRSPAAGIINFSSNGIFNLPRYYPSYHPFDDKDDDDDNEAKSTWRSGEHQRTIPFYRDQPLDEDDNVEPIYSKPNKAVRRSAGSGVVPLPREQFTVALGSDLDESSRGNRRCCGRRRRCCSGSRGCCRTNCHRCRRDRGARRCSSCCCCGKPVRPTCVCVLVGLILLAIIIVSLAIFFAVYFVVTAPVPIPTTTTTENRTSVAATTSLLVKHSNETTTHHYKRNVTDTATQDTTAAEELGSTSTSSLAATNNSTLLRFVL